MTNLPDSPLGRLAHEIIDPNECPDGHARVFVRAADLSLALKALDLAEQCAYANGGEEPWRSLHFALSALHKVTE